MIESHNSKTDAAIAEMKKWRRPFLSETSEGVTYDSPLVDLCRRLERELNEARRECSRQARLLSMSAKREADLLDRLNDILNRPPLI